MKVLLKCAKVPCKSCPYRRDVPSGIWHRSEYDKLPRYDGEMCDQIQKGGVALFDCHRHDGHLCAGWVGTHGPHNLVALRLQEVDPSVYSYRSPVPLFATGRDACNHGKRDIKKPGVRAQRMSERLIKNALHKSAGD
jgi:hypothetical protein